MCMEAELNRAQKELSKSKDKLSRCNRTIQRIKVKCSLMKIEKKRRKQNEKKGGLSVSFKSF